MVKKILVDMQLEIEISKFDNSAVDQEKGQKSPEQVYEANLLNFVLSPYSDRLQNFLTDTFTELNFPDHIFKHLKEAKKLKRKKTLSASKKASTYSLN